ncbi:MAG TPA: hypothetical protein VNV60_01115 [Holophagaceae bacterium]|jgi:hypothetical protein|nr:hypothetical protein [Holophagaceae bacterium]
MGTTDTILEDWSRRKDADGVAWFSEDDLRRLGIQDHLMTVMQDVQHILRIHRSDKVVETAGHTGGFSVRETL